MFSQVECQCITNYACYDDVEKLKKIIETTDEHGNDRCGFNTFCPSLNGKLEHFKKTNYYRSGSVDE